MSPLKKIKFKLRTHSKNFVTRLESSLVYRLDSIESRLWTVSRRKTFPKMYTNVKKVNKQCFSTIFRAFFFVWKFKNRIDHWFSTISSILSTIDKIEFGIHGSKIWISDLFHCHMTMALVRASWFPESGPLIHLHHNYCWFILNMKSWT